MRMHTINLKQVDMLCHKCLLNVVKAISHIDGIQELDVDLESKKIKISYDNDKFSRQIIQDIISQAIVKGKVNIELLTHY